MGLRINTNVASLNAQNNLSKNTKQLNQSLTRLSTGLRINSGKDDVVGLAKSESLRSQIRGGDVARSNITNGSAFLGVAEGFLSELTGIAQGMRDLAVQAADNTLSSTDRENLTDALNAQMAEYNRLTSQAKFNGVSILDGTFSNKGIQVGFNEGDQIDISISDARSATIGKVAILTGSTRSVQTTTASTTAIDFTGVSSLQIGGTTIAASAFTADGVSNVESSESAISYVNAINSYSGQTGVTAQVLENEQTFTYGTTDSHALIQTQTLSINGVAIIDSTGGALTDDANGAADLVKLINDQSSQTGVVASQDTAAGTIKLTASDGRNIDVLVTGANSAGGGTNAFGLTGGSSNFVAGYRGEFKLTSNDAFTVSGASAEFATGGAINVQLDNNTTLDNVDFSTAQNAGTAISVLDKVVEQLSQRRAEVGSAATRLDIADAEMASRVENLSAAESAIRDADVAAETAKYTQANILQQAGATVLSQANSSPQIALTLLQSI